MAGHADAIDLRSDVKTLPTQEMLEAIARAELGDSKANEDPTVLRLEATAAERLGMEAAMLTISGMMANLVALMAHADPGQGVVLDPESHIYFYEGAHARIAALMPVLVESDDGRLDPQAVEHACARYGKSVSLRLLCLENAHNRSGGRVIPLDLHTRLCETAHAQGLAVHVDGARIFNAAVASGAPAAEYGRQADSIMFCLSKSLCCPLGSVLCGNREFIEKARRARRLLGGAMRQAGVFAAAGLVALESMVDRLAEDHANARLLAEGIERLPGLTVNCGGVETNMVNAGVETSGRSIADWTDACRANGVLVSAHRPDKLRFVTHRHITTGLVREAVRRIALTAEKLAGKN